MDRKTKPTGAFWEDHEYMTIIKKCRKMGLNPTKELREAIKKTTGTFFIEIDPPISKAGYSYPITELMFLKEGGELKAQAIMDPNL